MSASSEFAVVDNFAVGVFALDYYYYVHVEDVALLSMNVHAAIE